MGEATGTAEVFNELSFHLLSYLEQIAASIDGLKINAD